MAAEEAALLAESDIPSPRQQRRLWHGCSPGRTGEGLAAGHALPHTAGTPPPRAPPPAPGSPKQPERLGGGGEVLQPCEGSYGALRLLLLT